MYDNDNSFDQDGIKKPNQTEYIDRVEYERRIKEIVRCSQDILYFAEKYYTIVTLDKGKQIIKLYPKQAELLKLMQKEKRVVTLAVRQSGKTTSYSMFCLWYTMFNTDKAILIAADKQETAVDILSKIKIAYQYIPEWLKPGAAIWNKLGVTFANGSSIKVTATTENAGIGKTINCVIETSTIDVINNIDGMSYTMPINHLYKITNNKIDGTYVNRI